MALTTAQRQARYRKRLKERASFSGLPERAHHAVDKAVSALWAYFNRPLPDGGLHGDIDGCDTIADWRAQLAINPLYLLEYCRGMAVYPDGMTPDELAAVTAVAEIGNAVTLEAERPKASKKRKSAA